MSSEMPGGFNSAFLDHLQKQFGPGVTKRAKWHDPLVNHNLRYCDNCPCDGCRFAKVCLDGCDRYKRWLRSGKEYSRRPAQQEVA